MSSTTWPHLRAWCWIDCTSKPYCHSSRFIRVWEFHSMMWSKEREKVSFFCFMASQVLGNHSLLVWEDLEKHNFGYIFRANSITESVAEYCNRPLYTVSAGDIGTLPSSVELDLGKALRLAEKWNAIILIDEADVFLEQRTTNDLVRNGLVSGLVPP